MILLVNVNRQREFNISKLICRYAKYFYYNEDDVTIDEKIQANLIKLLDWDFSGDKGLGIFCSKFEKLKRSDITKLIEVIKENKYKIKESFWRGGGKKRVLEEKKVIYDAQERKKQKDYERLIVDDYKVSGRGKKARPCVYEGREYKSRQECQVKEGITIFELYEYLKKTGQV